MRAVIASFILVLSAAPAHAGGLLVNDTGAESFARAGAFVAKASDATALAHNPAGLAKTESFQLFVGASIVHFDLTFDRAGTYPDQPSEMDVPAYVGQEFPAVENESGAQPIPFIAAAVRWRQLAFAAGVYAPHGYAKREYPESVTVGGGDAPSPMRYDVLSQDAVVALPSIAVAYSFGKLDLGLRGTWGIGNVDARVAVWGVDNVPETPKRDVIFGVETSDWFAPTWGAGMLLRATDWLEVGAAYSASITVKNQGTTEYELGSDIGQPFGPGGPMTELLPIVGEDARCADGGTLESLKACVDFVLPATASIGARAILRDETGGERGDIELDVRWENWSEASDINVIVDGRESAVGIAIYPVRIRHGFDDTWAVRLGGSYRLAMGLGLRGGIAYDTAAAPKSWTRADLDGLARLTVAGGVAWQFSRVRLEGGAAWVHSGKRTVGADDVGPDTSPSPVAPLLAVDVQPEHPFNAGTYDSGYLMAALGLVWAW